MTDITESIFSLFQKKFDSKRIENYNQIKNGSFETIKNKIKSAENNYNIQNLWIESLRANKEKQKGKQKINSFF